MALVMLPCDLPWWGSVSKHLTKLTNTKNTHELIEGMQKIHDMCCVSLDPDEEPPDPEQFIGLLNFLDNDLNSQDRSTFFNKTLPAIVKRAIQMKELKPRGGLHFSLQQQPDFVELPRAFVSSLVANAFFSTFPKRTSKSHPTLQNFNFSYFFKYLNANVQKAKLRGILQYFDWLEIEDHANGTIKFLRQVMSSKEWLTIEDWLECTLPLCPLQIRHEGRMEKSESDALHMCFSSAKIGGSVLENGQSQECVNLCTIPEILSVLLNVESLEDNEIFRIENVRVTSRIIDPKNRSNFEKNESPDEITVCCVDAEDYSKLPLGQYEEDNILRELNKCLLAFQQKQYKECHPNITVTHSGNPHPAALHKLQQQRRLSPIGESLASAPQGSNSDRLPIITQQSCSTKSGGSVSFDDNKNNNSSTNANSNLLTVKAEYTFTPKRVADTSEAAIANRRHKFILLGSSGECLPVKRLKSPAIESSLSSSLDESEEEDEFHSAKTSLEDVSEDEDCQKRYSIELDTKEHRNTFAQRLRDALRRENSSVTTESVDSESSYAVGISVTGSGLLDQNIKVKRRGSTGFQLQEESLDEDFLNHSLQQEKQWIDKFKSKQTGLSRKESNKSSEYSFSTDYNSSSELEEVYEQFSRWLEDPLLETEKGKKRQLDARDLAVVQFAGSLLKRTLSESFAGVPITDGCEQNSAIINPPEYHNDAKHKLVLNAKSLSLELARHKHKLAAQLAEYVEPNVLAEGAVESPDNKETTVPTVSDKSCEGQSNVTKRVRPRLNWVATTVTAVVQTLEDICVNVSLPLSKPEAVTQVTLSQIALRPKDGIRPISTGNWGCGTSKRGDVQLKVLIQWMAASVAGTPFLIYYTYGHKDLATLDTLCRLLIDRRWTVKDLTQAALRFASRLIHDGGTMENGGDSNHTLFEELIGVDRSS